MAKKILCVITLMLALVCVLASCGDEHMCNYSIKETVKAATCETKGEERHKCECGNYRTESTPLAHKYVNGKCSLCNRVEPTKDLIYISNGDGTCSVELNFDVKNTVTSIVIPEQSPEGDIVTRIPECAFSGSESLKSVVISDTVTHIDSNAFGDLEHLTIGSGVYYIEDIISVSKSICIKNIKKWLEYNDFGSNISRYQANDTVSLLDVDGKEIEELVIPDGATQIPTHAFSYLGIKKVVIPDSVTNIGRDAFYNCDNLTEVVIGNGVTTIDENAFSNCDKLNKVTMGNNVTSISYRAFSECKALESIVIPSSVTYIGSYAFSNCEALKSIEIPSSVTYLCDYAFYECTSLNIAKIGAEEIEGHVFENCRNLKEIIITHSVKQIGWSVFENCVRLTTVYLGGGLEYIESHAFYACNNIENIFYSGTSEDLKYIVNKSLNGTVTYETPLPTYDITTRYE